MGRKGTWGTNWKDIAHQIMFACIERDLQFCQFGDRAVMGTQKKQKQTEANQGKQKKEGNVIS